MGGFYVFTAHHWRVAQIGDHLLVPYYYPFIDLPSICVFSLGQLLPATGKRVSEVLDTMDIWLDHDRATCDR